MLDRREIADGVHVLAFQRDFDFRPGQIVGLSSGDPMPFRWYSIASGTEDERIEVVFDVVAEGALTPLLARAEAGDTLLVTGPRGEFAETGTDGLWIATGTGIAPFRSMTRSGLGKRKILVHGARGRADFLFSGEFAASLGERYVRCASREEGPDLYPGRLSAWLRERENLDADHRYLLCGGADMVVDVRDILISRGVPWSNVLSEIYF